VQEGEGGPADLGDQRKQAIAEPYQLNSV
jgi:hypothetical protein